MFASCHPVSPSSRPFILQHLGHGYYVGLTWFFRVPVLASTWAMALVGLEH